MRPAVNGVAWSIIICLSMFFLRLWSVQIQNKQTMKFAQNVVVMPVKVLVRVYIGLLFLSQLSITRIHLSWMTKKRRCGRNLKQCAKNLLCKHAQNLQQKAWFKTIAQLAKKLSCSRKPGVKNVKINSILCYTFSFIHFHLFPLQLSSNTCMQPSSSLNMFYVLGLVLLLVLFFFFFLWFPCLS